MKILNYHVVERKKFTPIFSGCFPAAVSKVCHNRWVLILTIVNEYGMGYAVYRHRKTLVPHLVFVIWPIFEI